MKRIVLTLGAALSVAALAFAAFVLSPVFVGVALAAEAVVSNTTVDVGWFAKFFAEYLVPGLGTLLGAGLTYLANLVRVKWKLDIDAQHRDALQTALVNGAGLLVQKGVTALDGKTVDVGNPLVAMAIGYVQNAARDSLKHFGLGPEEIAQKLAAKLPLIAPPTAPAGPAPAAA